MTASMQPTRSIILYCKDSVPVFKKKASLHTHNILTTWSILWVFKIVLYFMLIPFKNSFEDNPLNGFSNSQIDPNACFQNHQSKSTSKCVICNEWISPYFLWRPETAPESKRVGGKEELLKLPCQPMDCNDLSLSSDASLLF